MTKRFSDDLILKLTKSLVNASGIANISDENLRNKVFNDLLLLINISDDALRMKAVENFVVILSGINSAVKLREKINTIFNISSGIAKILSYNEDNRLKRIIIDKLIETTSYVTSFHEEEGYHHNAPYKYGVSVLQNGILSRNGLNKIGFNIPTTVEYLGYVMPTDNANGTDFVSVAKVGVESDSSSDYVYDPYMVSQIDFCIDKLIKVDLKVGRCRQNYCNEYLVRDVIPSQYIRSIDVRFTNLAFLRSENYVLHIDSNAFFSQYNALIDMSRYILDNGLSTPIREVVNNSDVYVLDLERVASLEKIKTR